MEGMQLYTSGWLTERRGKGGAVYGAAHGVRLETQHFPNAVNCAAFPSPILRRGETLHEWTSFRFFTKWAKAPVFDFRKRELLLTKKNGNSRLTGDSEVSY